MEELESVIEQHFPSLPTNFDQRFYMDFIVQIKQLKELVAILSAVPLIQSKVAVCHKTHNTIPSNITTLAVFHNLQLLLECSKNKTSSVETTLAKVLDEHPKKSEAKLRSLMDQMSDHPALLEGRLPFISRSNFRTLGVGRWLDDEIINYFVKKWCTRSGSTLGLSTFFACKILFQQDSCLEAKTGILTADDERQATRWCKKALLGLNLDNWDSIFIPINENGSHWYSACIGFRLKRIEIYDSLRETCIENRRKPIALRKNTNLMLMLMWLAEVLGRLRGEEVQLKDNPETDWVCDPHAKVHFQPNTYDCGVHTLWHLQHVLAFQRVRAGEDSCLSQLAFTDNMVGKRVRLAQELLDDCGI